MRGKWCALIYSSKMMERRYDTRFYNKQLSVQKSKVCQLTKEHKEQQKQIRDLQKRLQNAYNDYKDHRQEIVTYFCRRAGGAAVNRCISCNVARAFICLPCTHIQMCACCFAKMVDVSGKPTCPLCREPVISFAAPNGSCLPWWSFKA